MRINRKSLSLHDGLMQKITKRGDAGMRDTETLKHGDFAPMSKQYFEQ